MLSSFDQIGRNHCFLIENFLKIFEKIFEILGTIYIYKLNPS